MHYQVHETFVTIQGEGIHAGETALFVRLQGCPVGCEWCDAKLTWFAGGTKMTTDDLTNRHALALFGRDEARPRWCVITGGEPLLYDLDALLAWADGHRLRTQIETSGTYNFKGVARPRWTTVSPKHRANYVVHGSVLAAASEFKYVVDEHFNEALPAAHLDAWQRIHPYAPPNMTPPIVLMPEGSPPRPEMVRRTLDLLARHGDWRFGPRLQYAYSAIADREGDTNRQISETEAREAARAHAEGRRTG